MQRILVCDKANNFTGKSLRGRLKRKSVTKVPAFDTENA